MRHLISLIAHATPLHQTTLCKLSSAEKRLNRAILDTSHKITFAKYA
jgi:hypothetical protein